MEAKEISLIDVSQEIKNDAKILRGFALICHFIGDTPSRAAIKESIKVNWQSKVLLRFFPKNFFMVVFANEETMKRVAEGGVWHMDNFPLYMQTWEKKLIPPG